MGDGMKWGRRLASVTPNQPVAVRSTKASREDKAALRVGGAMRVGGERKRMRPPARCVPAKSGRHGCLSERARIEGAP